MIHWELATQTHKLNPFKIFTPTTSLLEMVLYPLAWCNDPQVYARDNARDKASGNLSSHSLNPRWVHGMFSWPWNQTPECYLCQLLDNRWQQYWSHPEDLDVIHSFHHQISVIVSSKFDAMPQALINMIYLEMLWSSPAKPDQARNWWYIDVMESEAQQLSMMTSFQPPRWPGKGYIS